MRANVMDNFDMRLVQCNGRKLINLRILWDEGVDVFGGYSNQNFNMPSMLFCSINDFPIYENLFGTTYHQLTHGRNTSYLRHRKFLKANHIKLLKNVKENNVASRTLTRDEVFEHVKDINDKKKDDVNARLDLVDMGIRQRWTYLPPTCHTMTKKEKRNLKSVGLKSHYCHVLMQQLLLVAIHDVLPKNVGEVLNKLCLLFNVICSKVKNRHHPEASIVETYMFGTESMGVLKSHHKGRCGGNGTREAQDHKSTMQNSGVMVVTKSMYFSTLKDKNSIMPFICYFEGVYYTKLKASVFKCKWLDNNMVDLNKVGYKEEPFIMTSYTKQVFYVNDQSNKRSMHESNENQDTSLDLTNTTSFSTCMSTFNDKNEVDDVHVTRHYHIKNFWENIAKNHVRILYKNWDNVPGSINNMMWKTIIGYYFYLVCIRISALIFPKTGLNKRR
ncbi:hypothetical protein CR513_39187, partial [Mucuna pruriens]